MGERMGKKRARPIQLPACSYDGGTGEKKISQSDENKQLCAEAHAPTADASWILAIICAKCNMAEKMEALNFEIADTRTTTRKINNFCFCLASDALLAFNSINLSISVRR